LVRLGSNCDMPAQTGCVRFTPDTGSDGPHQPHGLRSPFQSVCGEIGCVILDDSPRGPARAFRRAGDDLVNLDGVERFVNHQGIAMASTASRSRRSTPWPRRRRTADRRRWRSVAPFDGSLASAEYPLMGLRDGTAGGFLSRLNERTCAAPQPEPMPCNLIPFIAPPVLRWFGSRTVIADCPALR
jgi:hypothetical protein